MAAGDFKTSALLAGKILASGQLASGDNAIYTVPALSAVKMATATLGNVSTAAVTVSVSVIPNGQVLDATRKIMPSYVLAAGDSTSVTELVGAMLDAGVVISISASAASAVNYLLTGAVSS